MIWVMASTPCNNYRLSGSSISRSVIKAMRLPPKDPKERDLEGRLPLADVLEVMRRHHVSVETEDPTLDGRVCCTLVDDTVAEVVFLPDPVGG